MALSILQDVPKVYSDIELLYRRYLVKVIMALSLPILVGFTVYDIFIQRYVPAVILFLMLSVILFLGYLVRKPILKAKEDLFYRYFFTFLFILLGLYLAYTIGYEGKLSRIPWAYLFPVLIFFALGEKKALLWVSILVAVMLLLGSQYSSKENIVVQELKFRFYISFTFIVVFSYLAERLRRKYQSDLIENQKILKDSENRYREAYKQLNHEMAVRKKAEEKLRYRSEFEHLISNISSRFISIRSNQIDSEFNLTLEQIGEFDHVDRGYVFLFSNDYKNFSCTHEWCAEGVAPAIHRFQNMPVDELPWAMKRHLGGEILHIPRVSELPPEARVEKQEFESQGIKSMVCVPMFTAEKVIGFIGFDSVRREKTWSEEITSLIGLVGQILASALENKNAAEVLRQSEERFREMAESIREVFWLFDHVERRVLYCSPAYEEIWGRSIEALYNRYEEWGESIHPEDLHYAQQSFDKIVETGGGETREYRIVRPDGSIRWLSDRGFPIKDQKGNVIRITGIAEDITERKRAEIALQESEEKYKNLFNNAQVGIFRSSIKDGKLLESNLRNAEIGGWNNVDEFLNDWVGSKRYVDPGTRERLLEMLDEKGEVKNFEARFLGKNNTVFWARMSVRMDKPAGYIEGVIQDVTDEKEALETLRQSEMRYRAVVEDMPAMICRSLPDGSLTFVNDTYCKTFAAQRDSLIGQNFFQFIPETDREKIRNSFLSLNKQKSIITYEHKALGPDGKLVWQEWTGRALFDEQGNISEYQSIGQDITTRKMAEEELIRSEARLKEAQKIAHVGDWNLNVENGKASWSEELRRIMGIGPEVAAGPKTLLSLVHPSDRNMVEGSMMDALEKDKPYDVEYRIIRQDGEERAIHSRARVVRSEDGRPVRMVGVAQDMTDQMRIQADLKEAYDIINKSPAVAFLWKNQEGWPVELVTENVKELFGYNAQDLISGVVPYSETVHPDDLDRVADEVSTYSSEAGRERFSHEPYRIVCKNGQVKWVDDRTYIRREKNGNITHYQGLVLDVTSSKEAELALKESEEKFRNLSEKSPNMIFINQRGRVVYANKRCEEVMGYEREQLYAPEFDFFSLIAPESMETIKQALKKHMAGEEVEPYEYSIIKKDGQKIDVINATKLIDYQGEQAILGIVTDITDRKRLEQEREGLIAELEAKNAELERFTYTVSHDLKSPLITIRGFLGLLENDLAKGDTNRLKQDIKRISHATDQMKTLMDELLELSRIGRLVNPPESIESERLVREALESLAGIIHDKGVKVDIPSDLPVILGDRIRLLEVYQNIIENAVKFMGNQSMPHIDIYARQDDGNTVFYIKDNGMGIDPRYHEKIFSLFEKLDSEAEGTGVGLALSKRIIELHGGRIWVESDGPGKGSTFCFTLSGEDKPQAIKEGRDER